MYSSLVERSYRIKGGECLRSSFHGIKLSDVIFVAGYDINIVVEQVDKKGDVVRTIGPHPVPSLIESIQQIPVNVLGMEVRRITIDDNNNLKIVVYEDEKFHLF